MATKRKRDDKTSKNVEFRKQTKHLNEPDNKKMGFKPTNLKSKKSVFPTKKETNTKITERTGLGMNSHKTKNLSVKNEKQRNFESKVSVLKEDLKMSCETGKKMLQPVLKLEEKSVMKNKAVFKEARKQSRTSAHQKKFSTNAYPVNGKNNDSNVATRPPVSLPSQFSTNWTTLKQTLSQQTKKRTYRPKHSLKHKPTEPYLDSKAPESEKIWFDDVDDILLETLNQRETIHPVKTDRKIAKTDQSDDRLVKPGSFPGLTRAVAVDCEMVGVGDGGKDSVLARVSIVNHFGKCIYDKYVKPREAVTDYRTHVSGIRPQDFINAEEFQTVQEDVNNIFKDRIVVGHALENDFKVLFLDHPRKRIRDTSVYKPFRKLFGGRKPSLKNLSETVLKVKVQEGEHNSVQDAQAAMRLYTMFRKQWEKDIKLKRKPKTKKKQKKSK